MNDDFEKRFAKAGIDVDDAVKQMENAVKGTTSNIPPNVQAHILELEHRAELDSLQYKMADTLEKMNATMKAEHAARVEAEAKADRAEKRQLRIDIILIICGVIAASGVAIPGIIWLCQYLSSCI